MEPEIITVVRQHLSGTTVLSAQARNTAMELFIVAVQTDPVLAKYCVFSLKAREKLYKVIFVGPTASDSFIQALLEQYDIAQTKATEIGEAFSAMELLFQKQQEL